MRLAFDIGGTNTRVSEAHAGSLGDVQRYPTPADSARGVELLLSTLRRVAKDATIEAIAGGFPGAVTKEGSIERAENIPGWIGCDLSKTLSAACGNIPVIIRNDADMAALGEATYGAGKGFAVVAYIGLGTGVGTARVVDGALDRGRFGTEPGTQVMDFDDGTTLESRIGGKTIFETRGVRPEVAPRALYDELTPVLADGLARLIERWAPEAIVLGGSLMNEENGFRLADVIAALERLNAQSIPLPAIIKAALGDTAGLHGGGAILERL